MREENEMKISQKPQGNLSAPLNLIASVQRYLLLLISIFFTTMCVYFSFLIQTLSEAFFGK